VEEGVGFEELPIALADAGAVEVKVVAAGVALAEEEVGLVDAVDLAVGGDLEAGQRGEGGEEVDGGEDGVVDAAGGDFARPADDAGDAVAGLVGRTLAVAQRAGLATEDRALRVAFLFLSRR